MSRTIAITGAASGIGAALAKRLTSEGHRVIGVDVQKSDIEADLSTAAGRKAAIAAVKEACGGVLDGLVPCAGLSGLPNRAGSILVSLNYFGTIELLEGLRECLARAEAPAAVAISSNSTTIQPGGRVPPSAWIPCHASGASG